MSDSLVVMEGCPHPLHLNAKDLRGARPCGHCMGWIKAQPCTDCDGEGRDRGGLM